MGDHDVTNARVSDTGLRELYGRMLDARTGRGRAECVTPEAMLALVRRAGAEGDRLATLDHVMACGDCSRELELLRALEQAGAESRESRSAAPVARASAADVTPIRGRPSALWRRFAPLALAASLVIAVGIGVLGRGAGPATEDVFRGTGVAVTLLAPAADVRPGVPVTFAWRPVPGAARYALEVLDAAANVVFSSTTPDTTATVTDARRLTPGAEYRWWVRAVDASGDQRVSPMRPLRVRRE